MSKSKDTYEPAGQESRICDYCKKPFPVTRKWQKFCNTKCRTGNYWKHHKIVKVENND